MLVGIGEIYYLTSVLKHFSVELEDRTAGLENALLGRKHTVGINWPQQGRNYFTGIKT